MSRRTRNIQTNQSARCVGIHLLFYNSQFNTTSHEKLLKKLKQEFAKLPLEKFFEDYVSCLKTLFLIGEKHGTVERALDFAAKFCVSLYDNQENEEDEDGDDEDMPPFVKKVFDFLLEIHQTRNQNIRFRVCQFINKILSSLGEEASLDDNMCNRICTNMLERLQDKVPAVRAQAVMALQRLQDPTNQDCPVIKAFLFHLGADPSVAVRRSVLSCIGLSNITLPHILERTRDVKDTVRRHAYVVLTKISIRSLTIKQRERLLREGLKDRSECVSNFVATALLPGWLCNMKGDYMALLHALDVENSTETPILALNTLFKHRPMTEVMDNLVPHQKDKMIPLEKLTSENALYWRCLAQYLHAEGAEVEEELDKIIPNLTPFCQYIRRYYLAESPTDDTDSWSQIQRQFVVLQLLELTKVFDLADEMGRQVINSLFLTLEGLVKILVQILVNVDPDVNSRLPFLAEIVSEVHEPMTEVSVELSAEEVRKKQLLQAKVRVQLNEIREEQEEAVQQQDFIRAQVLLNKIKELQEELQRLSAQPDVVHEQVREQRNDHATLSKCLCIIYEMMYSKTVTVLTPHLRSLMENFVLHYIEDCDTYVRSLALRALGVCCLLSQDVAKKYILVFYFQLANSEADEVCTMAVKVIFDLFLLYGLQAFQFEENGEDEENEREVADRDDITKSNNEVTSAVNASSSNFIRILTSLLDSTSADIRTAAAKGLIKLLVNDRIKSPNLVSHLLIMWYNPVTEGDVYLRQMLGAFFTTLAYESKYGQEMLEQAFLPTLRTLFQAPVTSPLVEVDQDGVVRLMLQLTRPGNKKSNVHNNLAIALCNEVLLDSDPYNKQVLLRALTQLELLLDDEIVLQNISTLAEKVAESIQDRSCLRLVRKFQHMLSPGRRSLTVSDTTATTETVTGTSVITDVEQQTVDTAECSATCPKVQVPHRIVNKVGTTGMLMERKHVIKTGTRGQLAATVPRHAALPHAKASPGSPEHIESDWSDSDDNVQFSTACSTTKMVVPETPDNSDNSE
ncbi:hypothetical protein Cfor_11336 [Coptotermes formosanus]|uniref:Nuclear condensin complex subunit 3 C-terminal domain-containing protein n=1 Tax=Coptotermes formosanus TaxID=36987 RepID=A0A6L2PDI0_COPFO|nr:hypothetical protein Cfor_11336 [Coptotermes formosanus]